MRCRRRLASVLVALCVPALLAVAGSDPAAAAGHANAAGRGAAGVVRTAAHRPASARLAAFSSCADLVGYARRNFARTGGAPEPVVTAFGVAPGSARVPTGASLQAPAPASVPATGGATGGAPTFSTTNDQEAGVDEPDIAKTDGTTLFTVSGTKLFAVSVAGATPRLAGSLDLGSAGGGAQLLLRGSRLIVIFASGGYAYPVGVRPGIALPGNFGAATTIEEVDVHDPAAMKVTRTMRIDGSFVDARQNGATARLVISSGPRPVVYAGAGQRGSARSWVPSRRFHSALTGRSYVRPVAPCQKIRRPAVFSGLGMLTIFTIDLDKGLYTADTQALMADAQIVYGSTTSLYVATQRWISPQLTAAEVPVSPGTLISRFDVSDPTRTRLVASGSVPGYLLNQYSLSEYGGYLRVATTSRPIWWGGGLPAGLGSSSAVTVLAPRGGVLAPVGSVGGLGAGQQIYSVRFVGDSGYVVTYRQVDPFYVIDLRTPTAPRVAGMVELAGYSSYLHPIAPGLILGVGQAVGPGNEPAGTQLELFDVSDPSAPRLIARTSLGDGSSSTVQYDPHAFLFWPPTTLAVLPVQIFTPPPPVVEPGVALAPGQAPTPGPAIVAPLPAGFTGAIGYRVDASGIAEVGRIAHPAIAGGYVPPISRSIVVGARLFTVSDGGVLASALDSLGPETFVAFPAPVAPPPGPVPLAGVRAR